MDLKQPETKPIPDLCDKCDGHGYVYKDQDSDDRRTCPECKGEGVRALR
jgi:DnaJ-class molecular chaperone